LIRPRGPRGYGAACGILLIGLAVCGGAGALRGAHAAEPRHAIAMHGAPALPEGFTRLPYANPTAPKGGRLAQGVLGTFDSLHPTHRNGLRAAVVRGLRGGELDGSGLGRAISVLWFDRALGRARRPPQLRLFPPRPRREVLRRQTRHRRGRHLLLATSAR